MDDDTLSTPLQRWAMLQTALKLIAEGCSQRLEPMLIGNEGEIRFSGPVLFCHHPHIHQGLESWYIDLSPRANPSSE